MPTFSSPDYVHLQQQSSVSTLTSSGSALGAARTPPELDQVDDDDRVYQPLELAAGDDSAALAVHFSGGGTPLTSMANGGRGSLASSNKSWLTRLRAALDQRRWRRLLPLLAALLFLFVFALLLVALAGGGDSNGTP